MVVRSKLTHAEISFYADCFEIGLVNSFETLEGGSENTNYVLQTSRGNFILTISEDKNVEMLKTLIELQDHLINHKFQTSIIRRMPNGKAIADYNGKPVILKDFIPGGIVKSPSLERLFQIGVIAAKLHQIPMFQGIRDVFPYGIGHFDEVRDWDHDSPFIDWLKNMRNFLIANLPTDIPQGVVHGDIFLDNLIENQGRLVALIDFEETSNSPFVFEIGMAIIGTCVENSEINFKSAKALVAGYESVRPLSDLEANAIRVYCVYASTVIAFWRFRQFNIILPNDIQAMKYYEMVLLAESIMEIPANSFRDKIFK